MNGTWRFIKFMIKLTFIFVKVFIFPVFLLCKLLDYSCEERKTNIIQAGEGRVEGGEEDAN